MRDAFEANPWAGGSPGPEPAGPRGGSGGSGDAYYAPPASVPALRVPPASRPQPPHPAHHPQPVPATDRPCCAPGLAPGAGAGTLPVINGGCCGGPRGLASPEARPMRDDEGPSREDLQRFSGVTRTCPHCRKDVFDDVELCYHCGRALDGEDETKGPPTWVYLTAGLLLAMFVLFLLLRGRVF